MNYLEKILHWRLIVTYLIVVLGLTIIITATLGPAHISPLVVLKMLASRLPLVDRLVTPSWSVAEDTIIFQIRLPRIILGVFVGAALGVAGATMQGLFKNPMADPYIIGISSGAALGATFAIAFGLNLLGIHTIPLMAFIFAVGAIFLVYNIASVGGKLPVGTLLLAGIAVSLFLSAITSFMMYISGEKLHGIVFWLMGGLWARSWDHVWMAVPWICLGSAIIYIFARDLNVMLLGEEPAQHLGIEVEILKKIMMVSASLIAAAAVAVSGIIGFVGLIIPHIMRILVGPDHRILLPGSALVGGIFLVWADTLARTIIAPTELPVGIITALFGGPFFIYLLRKRKRSMF
ncbi:MAG: iron chelate uptake ABC transporter family permease subunit [Methanocellales archaeon]|nr:iron chelate uptake ABC transporter family permease subunit [Methanocellales archaeon]